MFHFQARWREELKVTCSSGSFILEFPMGVLTVLLPTEKFWSKKAPSWAANLWSVLQAELAAWCEMEKIELVICDDASVY